MNKLLTFDYDIISELTTFSQKANSFEAEEGCNDDLAMCLVIFAWLVAQDYFKEMTDNDVRKRIYEEQKKSNRSKTWHHLDSYQTDLMIKEVLLIKMEIYGTLTNMVTDLICGIICNGINCKQCN